MIKIIITSPVSDRHLSVAPGDSLMTALRTAGVEEVEAMCGGAAACGTCHVILSPEWLARVEPPGADEEAMLDCIDGREPGSRLSCQIGLTVELDGLCVSVP